MFYLCCTVACGKPGIFLLGEIRYVKSFVKLFNGIIKASNLHVCFAFDCFMFTNLSKANCKSAAADNHFLLLWLWKAGLNGNVHFAFVFILGIFSFFNFTVFLVFRPFLCKMDQSNTFITSILPQLCVFKH